MHPLLYEALQQSCGACSTERWKLWQVDVFPASHGPGALVLALKDALSEVVAACVAATCLGVRGLSFEV